MSDLMAKCDWYDGTLSVVLSEDPERIAVRIFDSRLAPARLYVPEVETLALRDENARMRSCLSDDAENARMIMGENAKLRELVGDMCEWAYVDSQCDLQGEFADRMRELGIEVGDA